MALNKPSWLKDAIATPQGFVTAKGEKLKNVQLTQGFCDEWNGDAPAAVEEAPVVVEETVEEVAPVEEAPKKVTKKKKKTTKKKKVAAKVENEAEDLEEK